MQQGNDMGYLWKRTSGILDKGIADGTDSDDFHAKLLSVQPCREKLCPGFYYWFLTHHKKSFSRVSSSLQEKVHW